MNADSHNVEILMNELLAAGGESPPNSLPCPPLDRSPAPEVAQETFSDFRLGYEDALTTLMAENEQLKAEQAAREDAQKRRLERAAETRLANHESEQKGCQTFCDSISNNLFTTDAAGHLMVSSRVKDTWRARRSVDLWNMTPELVDLWHGIDHKKEEEEQAKEAKKVEKEQAKQAKEVVAREKAAAKEAKEVVAREKAAAKEAKQLEDKRKAEALLDKSASDRDELVRKLNDAALVRDAAKVELDRAEQAQKQACQMALDAGGNPTARVTKLALQMENKAKSLKTKCEKECVAKSKAFEKARQRLKDHDSNIVKLKAKVRSLAENRKRNHTDISSQ